MPYLPVELDALDEFDTAANLAGMDPGHVVRGMLRLWRDCVRRKSAYVAAERLPGFFQGYRPELLCALETCEFLGRIEPEGMEPSTYLVRGAPRRLLQGSFQEAGGKARASNAKRDSKGRLLASDSEQTSSKPTSTPPVDVQQESSKHTAKIQLLHPTPNTQHLTPKEEAAAALRPHGRPAAKKPDRPRAEWDCHDFEEWAQWLRQEQVGLPPEDRVPITTLERWWRVVMEWAGMDVEPVCAGFVSFGNDPHWETQRLPFKAFMKQWNKYCQKEPVNARV